MIVTNSSQKADIGGTIDSYQWHYLENKYELKFETIGNGKPILLLPAFSTVSSRSEMGKIASILSYKFRVTIIDWLGFGDSTRPNLVYNPALYRQLLTDFITANFSEKLTIIAAGHAVGYALDFAKNRLESIDKIILIAPTWKGPLKAMGASETIASAVRNLVRMPIVGQFLYYLNTTPSFLRFMYRRHVYVDSNLLTDRFITEKRRNTQQKGARFAPAAFVTGGLDPFNNRGDFLDLISSIDLPILTIIAENAPPKSKAEMEAIATLKRDNLQVVSAKGTLGMQEEYGENLGRSILAYLT